MVMLSRVKKIDGSKIYFLVSNSTAERRGNVRPREKLGGTLEKLACLRLKMMGCFDRNS